MSDKDKWVEITVITSSEAVEAISALFYDLGAGGVAIEDPMDVIASNTSPKDWDYIEERLLPKDTKDVNVKGYLPYKDTIDHIVNSVKEFVERLGEFGLDKGKGEIITRDVKEEDWANAWKQYYKPFKIGKNIVIKPSWEDYDAKDEEVIIELDPGMAFGTGTHETTKMCIELLEKYMNKDEKVFDIGCGSGILSIAAAKLGSSNVTGVDIDEVAVKASIENVMISGVENVEIKHGNLFDVIEGKANTIMANIIADVIIAISSKVPNFLEKYGIFIASGIIKDRWNDVKDALIKNNFNIIETMEMGEWVAVVAGVKE